MGCGTGETDRFLASTFGDLHGVDMSERLIERARAAVPGVQYRSYDGERLPYEDSAFDLSFCINVMHHVPPPDWSAFVAEMERITRPGGVVAVFEHNPLNPLTRRVVSNCSFDADAVLLRRRVTERLLAGAGLTAIEGGYILFLPLAARLGASRGATATLGSARRPVLRGRTGPLAMCGINGILATSASFVCDEEIATRMRDAMSHRGPDDAGTWSSPDGRVALAQRRLSIVDLSPAGHNPMPNEDGTVWITYNGEVYNHRALREELEAKGHVYRSQTDTETILHLYEEEGPRCVERLHGMFAFAIWDSRTW